MFSLNASMRPLVKNLVVATALAMVATMLTVLFSVRAEAQNATPEAFGFSVAASADAMKMDIETGLFGDAFPAVPPDEPPMTGSAAYTEATYDDLGNNRALASAPYPGNFAVGMPGTLRGVSRPGGQPGIGQAPPIPNWPFIVSSTHPGREESAQVNGPYAISATSGEAGSVATAAVGSLGGASVMSPTSHSSATWDPSSGNFVAKAESSFAAFSLDEVLELADVESHAVLTSAPGADQPTLASSFEVGTMTVAGVTVGVTDKGFVVGPSANPRPDLGPLAPVLSAAGVEIEFLPMEATANSIRSAGLRITARQEYPVQGPVQETWTVGRVSAELDPGTAWSPVSSFAASEAAHDEDRPAMSEGGGDLTAAQSGEEGCAQGSQRFGEECYPNVAVITPALGFVSFGATFGGPIMCFMATGAAQSIGRGAGANAVANEVGKQVTPQCTSGPNRFGEGIAQIAKALGPLTAINPVVNPVIDAIAGGFRSFAESMGGNIAPFGPAAHEMGAFVEFFKGS